ncbi:DNA-3-methyladenine glycosylase 2 family protein [Georgenia sp. Z1344]|uniref:DNA-3-methyladenine glycosylase 2 family protein n=1 Tax=Georgenia sp. Z1344 TaxID=3416706 RepID=UPI003CE7322C
MDPIDDTAAYAACRSRDTRWDGRVYLGVTSTGVYCRPSCPARMPRPENCRFFRTASSAATAGFRACRRCRPDTLPGRRAPGETSVLVGRALEMIGAGVVDEAGVPGLAARLGLTERRLHRLLTGELGASALGLARTRRAQTARTLLEQTDLAVTDVAFAAGFASVRQFNDVVRAELGGSPTEVRARAPRMSGSSRGVDDGAAADRLPHGGATLTLRLRVRPPFDGPRLAGTIAQHAIAGVEGAGASAWAVLRAPGGSARVRVALPALAAPADGTPWGGDRVHVALRVGLVDLADLPFVVARVRRWLDLDAEPLAVDEHLRTDPMLAPLVAARPGLRVLGSLDPFRTLVVAILGQQVSLAATRTFSSRLADALGERVPGAEDMDEPADDDAPPRLFPAAEALAAAGPEAIRTAVRIPAARARTVHAAAELVAGGLDLGPGADRDEARARLLDVPGIGPWTVDLLALRGLGDPDALPPGDLVLRRSLARRLHATRDARSDARSDALSDLRPETSPAARLDPPAVTARAEAWRPWRAYATTHLWTDDLERS